MPHPELPLFFFVIAGVYASVGFGGGSSYLAVLALYALPVAEMRLTALLCNIIVVSGGTGVFIRRGEVPWRRVLPLLLLSVPMAYLGGRMRLTEAVYFRILGGSLVLAAVLLWISTGRKGTGEQQVVTGQRVVPAGILGGAIGFLSGLVGIGGGIFLAPLLHLARWDRARRIAATASLFILVNSISGIVGQLSGGIAQVHPGQVVALCLAVFAGGQIGSRLGATRFRPDHIRRLTAVLVFIAGTEVLWRYLFRFLYF